MTRRYSRRERHNIATHIDGDNRDRGVRTHTDVAEDGSFTVIGETGDDLGTGFITHVDPGKPSSFKYAWQERRGK